MATTKKKDAAAKKRSEASKKSAATRKANAKVAADSQAVESTENPQYQPKRAPLKAAGLNQHDAEAKRQAQLAEERDVHNERTGDPSVR